MLDPLLRPFVDATDDGDAERALNDLIRQHPERARLKNRLRYVFSTVRRLALWMRDDELACGLAAWRGRATESSAEQALSRLAGGDDRDWISMDRATLTRASVDRVAA